MTRRVLSVARWLSEALVALLLFLMMTVTVVDVSGRYLIHRPLIGSAEMIRYMLVMVIFISLPVVTEQDKHISISLVDSVLGARLNRLRRGLIRLIAGIAMVTVGFYMWRYAGLLVQNQDVIGSLLLPLAPAAYAVSGLSFVTGLIFVAMAGRKEG